MRFSYPEFSGETPQQPTQDLTPPTQNTVCTDTTPSPATREQNPPKGSLATACTVLGVVLLPLFMPVLGIALIFTLSAYSQIPLASKWVVTLVVAGLDTAFPMVIIYILKALGVVHDIGLNKRRDRLYPYIVAIVAMGLTAIYLHIVGAPQWIWAFYAGAAVTAAISLIVNTRWKISAHAAGIAGIVALLTVMARMGGTLFDITWWIAGTVILAGLLGSARVYMYRHTPLQVLAGYVVGFFPAYLLATY